MAHGIHAMWRSTWWVVCGVVFALLLGAAPTQARDSWGYTARSSRADVEAGFNALARLPTLRPSELDDTLSRLGFSHDMHSATWRSLSDLEQLSAAYRWAYAAGGPENGEKLIAAVANDYSRRYESMQFDPVFQQLFLSNGKPSNKIEFRKPTPSQLSEPLPREASRLIRRLAVYIDGPGPLGRANIARKIFGLEGAALEDTLGERKPREFLKAGSRRAPVPPPIYQRLNELVRDVIIASEAAGVDPELAKLAAEFRKKFGDIPALVAGAPRSSVIDGKEHVALDPLGRGPDIPGPEGPAASGGGSPERMARAAEMHRSFDAKHYPGKSEMRYSSVRVRGGGRGGVIAGAGVTSQIGNARLLSFRSAAHSVCGVRGKEIAKGDLVVVSVGGTYTLANVNCDVFFAARRIVYENLGVASWHDGDAIGLASIDTGGDLTRTFPYFLPADLDLSKAGLRKGMLLHPGLTDLDIGRAAALLDLWPSASLLIRSSTANDPAVIAWLRQLDGSRTWKWSDSPALITVESNAIVVRAKDKPSLISQRGFDRADLIAEEAADPVRKAAMLDQFKTNCINDGQSPLECGRKVAGLDQALTQAASAKEFGKEITALDAAVPVLVRSISDFARAEELFRILSLMRWAKQSGAPMPTSKMQLVASRAATPDTIVVGILGDYIAGASRAGAWEQECRLFLSRLQKALQQLKNDSDSLAKDRREIAWRILARDLRKAGLLHGTLDSPELSCIK